MKNIFNQQNKPLVIGMVHCAPLPGYDDFPGVERVKEKFINDLDALIEGGVNAIMIENNYDIPHYEKAKKTTIPLLTELCVLARSKTDKPLGLCVLWNDYEVALSIAKQANFNFVRIPVFVDEVETDYGIYKAKAEESVKFRKDIDAEDILLLTDVQVKHAKHLIKRPLHEATLAAIDRKSDGVIITGKWTGDPPTVDDVEDVKKVAEGVSVILGSGIDPENVGNYNVDGLIVGTYFKDKEDKGKDYHNVYPWSSEINVERVKKFMSSIK